MGTVTPATLAAELGISGDPDDLFYDRKRGCIYAICGAVQNRDHQLLTPISTKFRARLKPRPARARACSSPSVTPYLLPFPHHGAHEAEIRATGWNELIVWRRLGKPSDAARRAIAFREAFIPPAEFL